MGKKREKEKNTEDQADDYLAEINSGLSYRKLFGLDQTWLDIEAKFYSVSVNTDTAQNIIQSKGDALISALSYPDVTPMVRGLNEESSKNAPMVEAWGDRMLGVMGVAEQMEDALTHAYLFGVGLLKLGFDSEFGYDPEMKLGALGGTVSQFASDGRALESGYAKIGQPWCKAIDPRSVIVPWGTKNLAEATQIWHEVIRHIDDVKADAKYKNTVGLTATLSRKDVELSVGKPKETVEQSTETQDDTIEKEYIKIWEGMIRNTRKIVAVALTGEGKAVLIRDEINSNQIGSRLPWVEVRLTLRSRAFWTTPLAFYISPHQNELNDIHWQAKEQRRASVLKLVFRKNALDDAAKANLASAQPALFIEVDEGTTDLSDTFAFIGFNNNINTLLHEEEQHIVSNARDCIGISQGMAGEYPDKNRRPAAETNAVEQGAGMRLGRRQKGLQRSWAEVFKTVLGICAAHWGPSQSVEYMTAEGAKAWGRVTQEVLTKGSYAYEVRFSPQHAPTPKSRLQEAVGLYQAFAGNPAVDQMRLLENASAASGGKINAAAPQGAGKNANLPISLQGGTPGGGAGAGTGGATTGQTL